MKCAKRGNDVYRWRLKKRFKDLGDIEEVKFFDVDDRNAETPCLLVNLTYDVKRCDKKDAWRNIGKEWNLYITKLRKKFGKIDVIRVWESTEKGYPHIHAILFFTERKFKVFFMKNEKGVKVAKIEEKSDFEVYHSFVDVSAIDSLSHALNYVLKYLFKVHSESSGYKAQLTLANLWIHHKRAYSISGQFLSDLIMSMHNSNFDGRGQRSLDGNSAEYWEYLGMYDRTELKEEFKVDVGCNWISVLKVYDVG